MAGIIIEESEDCSTLFMTEMLRRAGYTVRTVSRITAELCGESPDLVIMYSDGPVLPGITQLAVMHRANSYSECMLRRAGVCCIMNTDVVDIVRIVRDYFRIPK